MDSNDQSLFVWRGTLEQDMWESECPWCGTDNILLRGPEDDDYNVQRRCECPLCGWYTSRYVCLSKTTGLFDGIYHMAALRPLGRDSVQLAMKEAISYLRSHFSDLYSTDWLQLEEAAEEIFRHHGFDTVLKRRCRDGEADLLLLANGLTESLVGCWKDAENRTLDVEAATALMGMRIEWDEDRAYLVTTTDVAEPARPEQVDRHICAYDMDLEAATEFAQALGIYNDRLPGPRDLDAEQREAIIEGNRRSVIRPGWHEQ